MKRSRSYGRVSVLQSTIAVAAIASRVARILRFWNLALLVLVFFWFVGSAHKLGLSPDWTLYFHVNMLHCILIAFAFNFGTLRVVIWDMVEGSIEVERTDVLLIRQALSFVAIFASAIAVLGSFRNPANFDSSFGKGLFVASMACTVIASVTGSLVYYFRGLRQAGGTLSSGLHTLVWSTSDKAECIRWFCVVEREL